MMVHLWKVIFVSFISTNARTATTTTTTSSTTSTRKTKSFDIDSWQVGDIQRTNITLIGTCFEEYWDDVIVFEPSTSTSTSTTATTTTTTTTTEPTLVDDDNDKQTTTRTRTRTIHINGFSFLGRIRALKFIINNDEEQIWNLPTSSSSSSTVDNEMEQVSFTDSNNNNNIRPFHWLWAYAAQLDWQWRSGRLVSFDSADNNNNNNNHHHSMVDDDNNSSNTMTDTISQDSWWGYMNFCFTIAVLRGYQNAGLVSNNNNNDIVIVLDEYSEELIRTDIGVQKSIDAWEAFFRYDYSNFRNNILIDNNKNTCTSTTVQQQQVQQKLTIDDTIITDKVYRNLRFNLQKQAWKAHTDVIHSARSSSKYHELLQKLPQPERLFGQGWAGMVEILAASCFPTDLWTLIQDGSGYLPLYIITDEKWEQYKNNNKQYTIKDSMELKRFYSVSITHEIIQMQPYQRKQIEQFWSRIVQDEHISRLMPRTVNELVHGTTIIKIQRLLHVLYLYLLPKQLIQKLVMTIKNKLKL